MLIAHEIDLGGETGLAKLHIWRSGIHTIRTRISSEYGFDLWFT